VAISANVSLQAGWLDSMRHPNRLNPKVICVSLRS
jgi:hypothetical protein